VSTTPSARKRKAGAKPARPRTVERHQARAKIVRLPRRGVERPGCLKCGSLFIEIEPAFVHCRYCGALSRIRGASLLAQEEYEMRSGLRLAS
jgi:hypothetical protein